MSARAHPRLIDHLPAIYRSGDSVDDLQSLLQVFEEFLFVGHRDDEIQVEGIGHWLDAVPDLFAPLDVDDEGPSSRPDGPRRAPDRFIPWIATWLAFTPHHLFEPERLRHIVSGIVPLYGKRGTRAYLKELLQLCFEEIHTVRVDEQLPAGLRVGISKLGLDSLLAEERPFCFSVNITLRPGGNSRSESNGAMRLEQQVRAIIDFAKPAHTDYELQLQHDASAAGAQP